MENSQPKTSELLLEKEELMGHVLALLEVGNQRKINPQAMLMALKVAIENVENQFGISISHYTKVAVEQS